MQNNIIVLKVSELNRYIKGLIHGDPRLRDLWVAGELSNFKHHRSGHMYFTLKDGNSALRCVYFRRDNEHCTFKPSDGMEVIVHGNVSVYEPSGVYQLYIFDMEPAGMGSLYLAYEQLKSRLEEEGLFKAEQKKKLPLLPRKIGLITSPTGAALQDMLATFKKRFPHVEILVVESLVQGSGAAGDLVHAIKLLDEKEEVELIILARGGGSIEDLWPFNDEAVARAVFKAKKPIISAIGHETDFTITDFVADYRAPTPTAAAAAAVPDLEEVQERLKQLSERAALTLRRRLQREKQTLDYIVSERFFNLPKYRAKKARETLQLLCTGLNRNTVRLLQYKGMKLGALQDKLDSYSPLQVMNRGYCFCRDKDNNIIRSVKNIEKYTLLKLNFTDGLARCRAEEIEEGNILDS
ncbi:MAG: exodeoxyribonuclease VII large subunit [Bacillota bacterium]